MDTFTTLWANPAFRRTVTVVVGVASIALLARVVERRLVRRIADSNARYRVRRATTAMAYTVALLFTLGTLAAELRSLTVAFGLAGAGVAFALQEVVMSIAGWMTLTFSGIYRVGDRVKLGAITGDVMDISVLRTTIMEVGGWIAGDQYNGRIVRVGNSAVFKEPVVNYTGDFPFLWDEITVPIRHGSDLSATRDLLNQTATDVVGDYTRRAAIEWKAVVAKYRIEEAQTDPIVSCVADHNWVTFTVRYVVDYRRRRTTKDALWTKVLRRLEEHPDTALAVSTLWIDAGPLNVRVTRRPGDPT